MPLQGQIFGLIATVILVGAISILAIFYIKRHATGFESQRVRRGLDIGWGLMLFGLVLWLILVD